MKRSRRMPIASRWPTCIGLTPADLAELAAELPTLPVRAVYGERDRLLPDISDTMTRLPRDVPQARVTPLPDAGHLLQLEQPDRVADLLAGFLAPGARDADEATIGKAKA